MCKFSHLKIGFLYSFTVYEASCDECGYEFEDTTVTLYYSGHIECNGFIKDKFDDPNPKKCPNCSDVKLHWLHICEDNPSLEIAYKMELPIESLSESPITQTGTERP